jgi:hypothetical protein
VPRVNGTKKPDPNAVYVAWQGAALADPDITLSKGSRLKGDHPAVRNNFWLFVEDGIADGDAPHELDHVVALAEAAEAALPDHDLRVTALPIPIEAAIVEAVRPVKLLVGGVGEAWTGGPAPTQVVTINAGTRFNATEPIVTQLPNAFRKV